MSLLEETIAKIQPPDEAASHAVRAHLAETMGGAEPLGALGELLERYAAITGETESSAAPQKCVIVCCADHGVAEMKVSAYPPSTTVQMTANYLISRGATANALANFAGAELLVVDLGIAADTDWIPGLVDRRIARGTKNCAKGPAMTGEEARRALETGIELAEKCAAEGVRCFLPGEMGIANTTSSACIVAAACGLTPEQATGRGTNISDERLKVKIEVVRQALAVNRPDPTDGLDLLAKVGGFELGCIAGIILGAAAHRAFVVLDGFNTGAAALIARALSPLVPNYLMSSHLAAEPAHRKILEALGLEPYMDMRFRLGEATGSSIAVNLLDATLLASGYPGRDAEDDPFACETMPKEPVTLTDKTFDFYLDTFPSPSKAAMAACQHRIDNLAKPVDCLGRLEEIAVTLAGIMDDERPETGLSRTLLVFSHGAMSDAQHRLTAAFAEHAEAEVVVGRLRSGCSPKDAFAFGRETAENLAFSTPLLALALTETDEADAFGTKARALAEALLTENGDLRYNAEDFLAHVPKPLQADVSALLGAMIAGAHNSALIVLDDASTEIVARYAEALCPALRPYVLHVQPALLHLGVTVPGGVVASLGLKLVDASLHMLNDMKTFAEARVPIAGDGPGATRQVE
ncbi:MAG: nicotinate-nucleotide--dimethylbenzimidazole phosphoribosyltransferase [Schwartzia sp.]|nr:nicotinate-nucleotide--dimethylbenzimidazole phosphoribosyltransferase [Schwartzia sp. (in: firmicutes)]